ncbi:hypothetical protein [Mycobacterium sp.]|uniref:hypothetical protein n=1 Tax=Mycobacterium sp. TaxID=1785 RepID=UPI0039C96C81
MSMDRENRGWPKYLFNGRLRTSTAALIVAFLLVWWLYQTFQPQPKLPEPTPATNVVPPGFVPDPNYTWVPRTALRQAPVTTTAPRTTTTTTTTTPTSPTETTSPTSPTSPTSTTSGTTTLTPPAPAIPGPGPSPGPPPPPS